MAERKKTPALEETAPALEEKATDLEITVRAMDESTAIARLTRDIATCHLRLEMLKDLRSSIRRHKQYRELVEKPLDYIYETDDDDDLLE